MYKRQDQGKVDLQTIIKQTKSKILDLDIHGKRVPQDPDEEPAIELLKRINPDFARCGNGHKWKLPQSWCWAKGRQIFVPMKSTKPHNDEFLYIDIDSIDNKRQIINKIKSCLLYTSLSRQKCVSKLHYMLKGYPISTKRIRSHYPLSLPPTARNYISVIFAKRMLVSSK